MSTRDTASEARKMIIDLANLMISEKIDLIEGVRRICTLRFSIENPENEILLPLRGIESDTDLFVSEKNRTIYSEEFLIKLDKEKKNYIDDMTIYIINECKEIILKL